MFNKIPVDYFHYTRSNEGKGALDELLQWKEGFL